VNQKYPQRKETRLVLETSVRMVFPVLLLETGFRTERTVVRLPELVCRPFECAVVADSETERPDDDQEKSMVLERFVKGAGQESVDLNATGPRRL
jgi:hypothetical protein